MFSKPMLLLFCTFVAAACAPLMNDPWHAAWTLYGMFAFAFIDYVFRKNT